MNNRDADVLKHILRYCNEIVEASDLFGNSLEALKSGSIYKNAVAMCILQIGELVNLLSDDFKETRTEMPWRDMKRMRDLAAHQYNKFDLETLWETVSEDIPELRDYCTSQIEQWVTSEIQVIESENDCANSSD